jgi:hypothetical protein
MALTKQTVTDKIETVKLGDHYVIQVREKNQIIEDGIEISFTYLRYVLQPDHDVSTITDSTIKAQFEAVMTKEVKSNYQTFLATPKTPG